MSSPFQLTLVRHGQTSANKAHIIQGSLDVPLSEVGREQARKLGQHFSENNITFTHIYSSDLSRALETATLALGNEREIKTDVRLRERAFGVIEGKSVDFYCATAHEAGFRDKDQGSYTPEGAETTEQVTTRVKAFLTDMLNQLRELEEEKRVLVVTHGGVIKQFMRIFSKECDCDFPEHTLKSVTPNTAVSVFDIISVPQDKVRVEIVKLHDVSHLQEGEATTTTPTKSTLPDSDNDGTPPKKSR